MRLTTEIRRFWPDRPPQEFHGWFVGVGAAWTAAGSIKTRVDEYVRDPDQDSLGIKKRGRGEVEIKGLISRRDKHLKFAKFSAAWPSAIPTYRRKNGWNSALG
jgi:hypothetical protein